MTRTTVKPPEGEAAKERADAADSTSALHADGAEATGPVEPRLDDLDLEDPRRTKFVDWRRLFSIGC